MHAVMNEQLMDFSILCGFRDKKDQNNAVKRGTSKLCWPHGRHNHMPSLAVDIAAYPIDEFSKENTDRTIMLATIVLQKAKDLKIPIFWGGHWTHLNDIYHFQLPSFYEKEAVQVESMRPIVIQENGPRRSNFLSFFNNW